MSRYQYTGTYKRTEVNGRAWRMAADPTLGMYQEITELADKQALEVGRLEKAEPGTLDFTEALVMTGLASREVLYLILHKGDHEAVRDLSLVDMKEVMDAWDLVPRGDYQGAEAVMTFDFPTGYLIEDQPTRKVHGWGKKYGAGKRGGFVVVPVAQLPLRSRVHTDSVRRGWPRMGKELADKLTEREKMVRQGLEESIEAKKAAYEVDKAIDKYVAELRAGVYKNLHRVLSHVCVPVTFPTYDEAKAEQRAELFKHLPLRIANGVTSFFSEAQATLNLSSVTYSRLMEVVAR